MDYVRKEKKQMVALYQDDVKFLKGEAIKDFKVADLIHFLISGEDCQKYEGRIFKTKEYRTRRIIIP